MKKGFQMIGVFILIWVSFFCTEKTAMVIKNTDQIMIKIKTQKSKYETKYIDSIIINNTMIPGLSGTKVDEEKSYEKMRRLGEYNSNLYVFEQVKPNISIYDNYDKYIISGNGANKNISIVFSSDDIDLIEKTINVIEENNISVSFYLSNYDNDIISRINHKKLDIVANKETFEKIKKSNIRLSCYNPNKDNNFLSKCYEKKVFSFIPNINVKKNLYLNIKQNLKPGIIVFSSLNNDIFHQLQSMIDYVKAKGYKIVSITELIEE